MYAKIHMAGVLTRSRTSTKLNVLLYDGFRYQKNRVTTTVPLLCVPFRRTSFARRPFSTDAPLTWNSLPPAILNCDSLSTFKSRLKTHLFSTVSANYSTYLFRQLLCSRLMALWRYTNFVLLLLLVCIGDAG